MPAKTARPSPDGAAFTARQLRDMEFPPPTWIVDGLLPGGLVLLAGKPKVGKSWLMLDAGRCVASGLPFLGRRTSPGQVLYAALEDTPRRLQLRLATLKDGEWSEHLTFWTHMAPVEEGGVEEVEKWIREQANPVMVVIDVYAKVRRSREAGEGVYDSDYKAAAKLKELADANPDMAIVLIHHLRKLPGGLDPLDEVSGSTGITGAVDTVMLLRHQAAGIALYGRGRDLEEVQQGLDFDRANCRFSPAHVAFGPSLSSERERVIQALADGPHAIGHIVHETGIVYGSLRRLLSNMVNDGQLIRAERGVYALPGLEADEGEAPANDNEDDDLPDEMF